jgi:hypothetical protein
MTQEKTKVKVDEQDNQKEEHEGGQDFYEYKSERKKKTNSPWPG